MRRKILVVDDKPFMLRLIQHHLERAGYQLIKARNQQEAIQAMAQQSPELVVMDDCSAPEETPSRKGKSKRVANSIPVIRMTEVPQDINDVDPDNAEVVLTKPFSPTRLVAEIKRLVP